MSSLNTEIQIYDLGADLVSEICSHLGVHDQANMKRICRWWRLNLPDTRLSRSVEVDGFRMKDQSENLLEQSLNTHIQKSTRVLVLRHIACEARSKKFGIIERVIKQKQANLTLLILRDCSVHTEFAGAAFCWLYADPQELPDFTLQRLLFATKKLILVNYTIRNALGQPVQELMYLPILWCDNVPHDRLYVSMRMELPLPIVLPRHEFDCTKPFLQHYHAFIMVLNFNCPEVSSDVRNDVVQLYNSWIHNDMPEYRWKLLGRLIKGFNDGDPGGYNRFGHDVDVSALRQLNPLTLNKLTMEALHRMYF